jgi:putative flippase GtrA
VRFSRFLKFLLVGGLAAGVNLVARYLLDMRMGYNSAIVLAYLVGMTVAFVLSKHFVFETSGRATRTELMRFVAINLAAVVQVWAVSVGLAEWLLPWFGIDAHRYDIAHAVGVSVPAITSYFGHKYYSFSRA